MKKYLFATTIAILSFASLAIAQSNSNYTFTNDLRVGSSGTDVTNLQTWLITNGYGIPAITSGSTNKGFFGEQTRAALTNYQRFVGLPAYGFFGPMTRSRLATNGNNNQPGPLRVVSPNGGEQWQRGTTQNITWTSPYYIRATYANIMLVPYYQPCAGYIDTPCPMNVEPCSGLSCARGGQANSGFGVAQPASYPYRASYTIASNVSINQNSYSWTVGRSLFPSTVANCSAEGSPPMPCPINQTIPDGQYTIQICEVGSTNCDYSNVPFTIYSRTLNNQAPVISGIDAPTTLTVGQTGTWTIHANDPVNGQLSYVIDWGDTPVTLPTTEAMPNHLFVQNSTFTHAYSNSGIYTVRVTVRNSVGLTAQTSTTVNVTGSNASTIRVISPNGGDIWYANSTHQIVWNYANASPDSKVDLYLTTTYNCPSGQGLTGTSCQPAIINLDKNIAANATYNWIVGTDIANNIIQPGNYYLHICVVNTSNCDTSDQPFTITTHLIQ